MANDPTPIFPRFWSKVAIGVPDECWHWGGAKSTGGYGSFHLGGRSVPAHRLAYELMVGEVPDGMLVDHACHKKDMGCAGKTCLHRLCVNPTHLQAITFQENIERGVSANKLKEFCPQGHEYSEENTYVKNGARWCRVCRREADLRYKNKKRMVAS